MTAEEIMELFDGVPSKEELSRINKMVQEQRKKLDALIVKENAVQKKYDNDLDKVANRLDRSCPNWRMILVKKNSHKF